VRGAEKASQEKRAKGSKKPKTGRRKENAVVRYFRQTWAELKKVHWPDRQEATNLTLIVLAVTAGMSAFLGVVDWLSALFFSLLVELTG
jgi:preprotein translocase subunit SecE